MPAHPPAPAPDNEGSRAQVPCQPPSYMQHLLRVALVVLVHVGLRAVPTCPALRNLRAQGVCGAARVEAI